MPNVITRPHRVAIARRSPVSSTATTEARPTFKRFEATSIEVPCLFCGGASKSRAVPRRLDDTVHLTPPERHRAISCLPRLDWRSRRGFSFHNAPPVHMIQADRNARDHAIRLGESEER